MNETSINEKSFVGYEYKDVLVRRSLESVIVDGYTNFGWTLESVNTSVQNFGSVILRFKRDRKIRNKVELTRLQRQFDSFVNEIESLEKSKIIGPSTVAYIIGVLGTAFITGSVFSHLGGNLALSIILAIPGFVGWVIPYFTYEALRKKKTIEIDPLIEEKYDDLYDISEKANSLLA